MTHGPNHDDVFDTLTIQLLLQIGIHKRVGGVLENDRLIVLRCDRAVDTNAVTAGVKIGEAGSGISW